MIPGLRRVVDPAPAWLNIGEACAALPEDAVEVGKVLDAWGIKGGFKVQPYAGDPQALFSTRRWYLMPPVSSAVVRPGSVADAASAGCRLIKVGQVRAQGDWVVAQAPDIADRTAAEGLRGARVYVPRGSFPTPGDDEHYWVDLIGLHVMNRDAVDLGTVVGLIDTGPHSVLRVQPAGDGSAPPAEERLIPFVAAYVDAVDKAQRRILVDWSLDY